MASCWFVLQVLMVLFYRNLHEFLPVDPINSGPTILSVNNNDDNDGEEEERRPLLAQNQPTTSRTTARAAAAAAVVSAGDGDEATESEGSKKQNSNTSPRSRYNHIRIVDNSEAGPLIVRLYNEYIREEVVCILTTTFTVFFMQTALEVRQIVII